MNPENFISLDTQKIQRFGLPESRLQYHGYPVDVRESKGFRPVHIVEQYGEKTIDFPIDAGTNFILHTPNEIPALVMALYEYDEVPTVHMIQRAKMKNEGFVIPTKELQKYRDTSFDLVEEFARRKKKPKLQSISGFRNLWAFDPDGEIPLSVLLTTYDVGLKDVGFIRTDTQGRPLDRESDQKIDQLTKRLINGKKVTQEEMVQTLKDFYFWQKRT